jgi:hypothetical protein
MGWSGGTDICTKAWGEIRAFVRPEDRPYCLKVFIETLADADWDTVDEIKTEEWPEMKQAFEMLGYGEDDESP